MTSYVVHFDEFLVEAAVHELTIHSKCSSDTVQAKRHQNKDSPCQKDSHRHRHSRSFDRALLKRCVVAVEVERYLTCSGARVCGAHPSGTARPMLSAPKILCHLCHVTAVNLSSCRITIRPCLRFVLASHMNAQPHHKHREEGSQHACTRQMYTCHVVPDIMLSINTI